MWVTPEPMSQLSEHPFASFTPLPYRLFEFLTGFQIPFFVLERGSKTKAADDAAADPQVVVLVRQPHAALRQRVQEGAQAHRDNPETQQDPPTRDLLAVHEATRRHGDQLAAASSYRYGHRAGLLGCNMQVNIRDRSIVDVLTLLWLVILDGEETKGSLTSGFTFSSATEAEKR
jgi:hypothetical protein